MLWELPEVRKVVSGYSLGWGELSDAATAVVAADIMEGSNRCELGYGILGSAQFPPEMGFRVGAVSGEYDVHAVRVMVDAVQLCLLSRGIVVAGGRFASGATARVAEVMGYPGKSSGYLDLGQALGLASEIVSSLGEGDFGWVAAFDSSLDKLGALYSSWEDLLKQKPSGRFDWCGYVHGRLSQFPGVPCKSKYLRQVTDEEFRRGFPSVDGYLTALRDIMMFILESRVVDRLYEGSVKGEGILGMRVGEMSNRWRPGWTFGCMSGSGWTPALNLNRKFDSLIVPYIKIVFDQRKVFDFRQFSVCFAWNLMVSLDVFHIGIELRNHGGFDKVVEQADAIVAEGGVFYGQAD